MVAGLLLSRIVHMHRISPHTYIFIPIGVAQTARIIIVVVIVTVLHYSLFCSWRWTLANTLIALGIHCGHWVRYMLGQCLITKHQSPWTDPIRRTVTNSDDHIRSHTRFIFNNIERYHEHKIYMYACILRILRITFSSLPDLLNIWNRTKNTLIWLAHSAR